MINRTVSALRARVAGASNGLVAALAGVAGASASLAVVVAVSCLSFSGFAQATPGAVDQHGCHKSKKEGIHCHAERARNSGGSDGTKSARDKRLKRECRGAVDAGMCTGHTK